MPPFTSPTSKVDLSFGSAGGGRVKEGRAGKFCWSLYLDLPRGEVPHLVGKHDRNERQWSGMCWETKKSV